MKLAALPLLALILAWPPGDPPPRRHVVEIRGMVFHPAVLTVAAGDTVVWINRDIVPHTATAADSAPPWDTGLIQQGREARYVPRRKGEAPYVCTLHPVMQGKLIIQ